jgi:hypothetical protein
VGNTYLKGSNCFTVSPKADRTSRFFEQRLFTVSKPQRSC